MGLINKVRFERKLEGGEAVNQEPMSVGSVFWASRTARAKVLQWGCARGGRGTARRPVWLRWSY